MVWVVVLDAGKVMVTEEAEVAEATLLTVLTVPMLAGMAEVEE